MEDKKKLNSRQVKFITNVLEGMTRVDAYMDAYGIVNDKEGKNRETARKSAYTLITTNCDVKAQIDDALDAQVERARRRLKEESDATVEHLLFLRDGGNKEYTVQFQACKDILDRIGLKPKEQFEHSGGITIINSIPGPQDDD